MNRSDVLNELATALSKAQSEIIGAIADSKNPFFKSSYADLESVWAAIRGPLTKNGLSIVQAPIPRDNGVEIETTLLHSSGQWLSGSLFMPADKNDPQTFGKLVSYIRRYSLTSLLCIPQVEDDAESAMNRHVMVNDVVKVNNNDHGPSQASSMMNREKPIVGDHTCEWRVSQYNKNQEYCAKCKSKRERSA